MKDRQMDTTCVFTEFYDCLKLLTILLGLLHTTLKPCVANIYSSFSKEFKKSQSLQLEVYGKSNLPLLPLIFKSRVVKSLLRQNELKILLARKIKKNKKMNICLCGCCIIILWGGGNFAGRVR